MKENVVGLKVDITTVKQLKKEIEDLRDKTLHLTKGSEEYNKTVAELQANQRVLNEAMALTKKESVALEGSYDALVHQMAQLKKEWRSTNDETRRNELGSQIEVINTQLKELDSSIGNNQRNVGNYEESIGNAFKNLKQEIKQYQNAVLQAEEGTEEYEEAMKQLANAQFQMRDMNEKARYAVADLGEQLSNVVGITSGIVSGFGALQGALVLCGAETEEFEKVMVKLQATMALVQGLQGLEGVQDRFTGLIQTIKIATKTIGKGGWLGIILAVVTALTALVVWLRKKNEATKDGIVTQKEYNKLMKESIVEETKAQAEAIARATVLLKIAKDTKLSAEERKRASFELAKAIGEEGAKAENLANNIGNLTTATKEYIKYLKEQAEAQALLNVITEKFEKIIELESGVGKTSKRLKKDLNEAKELRGEMNALIDKFVENNGISGLLSDNSKEQSQILKEKYEEEKKEIENRLALELNSIETSKKNEDAKAKAIYETKKKYLVEERKLVTKYMKENVDMNEEMQDINMRTATLNYEERKRLEDKSTENREKNLKKIEKLYNEEIALIEHTRNLEVERLSMTEGSPHTVILDALNEELKATDKTLTELLKLQEDYKKKGIKVTEEHSDKIKELTMKKDDILLKIDKEHYEERLRQKEKYEKKLNEDLGVNEFNSDIEKRKNNLKIDPKKDNQFEVEGMNLDVDIAMYEQKIQLLKDYLEERKDLLTNEDILAVNEEIADAEIAIEEKKNEKLLLAIEEFQAKKEKTITQITDVMNSMSQIIDAVYSNMEARAERDGEISKEEAEKLKQVQIAQAWITTLQGMINAFSTSNALPQPFGMIMAGINASAVLAMGIANINKMKAQEISGTVQPSANVPSSSSYSTQSYNYTRQLNGVKEVEELNKSQRVYVLESDITNAQKKSKVRVSETSF